MSKSNAMMYHTITQCLTGVYDRSKKNIGARYPSGYSVLGAIIHSVFKWVFTFHPVSFPGNLKIPRHFNRFQDCYRIGKPLLVS